MKTMNASDSGVRMFHQMRESRSRGELNIKYKCSKAREKFQTAS